MPDGSTPGVSGKVTRRAYLPARTTASSVRFTDTAWTLISTSPGPGSGIGTSSSFITLGGPNSRITMAFNSNLPGNFEQDTAAPYRGGQAAARYFGVESSGSRLAALRIRAISAESSRMNCTNASGVPSAAVSG